MPRITSITVETLAYLRLFAIEGTVYSLPSAARKFPSVNSLGSTLAYQSLEDATNSTPRWGSTATKVTQQKAAVQSRASGAARERAPPTEVALAIIAWPVRPKNPFPTA